MHVPSMQHNTPTAQSVSFEWNMSHPPLTCFLLYVIWAPDRVKCRVFHRFRNFHLPFFSFSCPSITGKPSCCISPVTWSTNRSTKRSQIGQQIEQKISQQVNHPIGQQKVEQKGQVGYGGKDGLCERNWLWLCFTFSGCIHRKQAQNFSSLSYSKTSKNLKPCSSEISRSWSWNKEK